MFNKDILAWFIVWGACVKISCKKVPVVLVFAGLAMMLIALFIKLNLSKVAMLIVAAVMCGFGTLLNGVDAGNPLANIFLGYLIGTEDAAGMVLSDFPILNWLMFPICGYVFGAILKRVKDKNLFYLTFSLPALIIAVFYFAIGIHFERGMFGEGQNCYYHMVFSDVLASLCLTVGIVGVYHFIVKIMPKRLFCIAQSISENITPIYFIHWVLISFIVNLFMFVIRGTTILTPWQIIGLGTAISIAAIVIAHFFRSLIGKKKSK